MSMRPALATKNISVYNVQTDLTELYLHVLNHEIQHK